jgi:translation initiation factor 3 subunit H
MVALEPEAATNAGDHERLDLGVGPLVEKNLEFLNDCLDDIVQEQQKARRAPARGCARGGRC